MITWLTRGFALLWLLLLFAPGVLAAEPREAELANLIKQLGHDDFGKREAASMRLAAIGEPALDALQRAKTSDDPEVRYRAAQIVAAINAVADNKLCVEQLRLTGHGLNPKFNGPHSGAVTTVSVSADGKRLLTGGFDKTLRLWDADTGRELRVFEGHTDAVTGAALSPDGARALSASGDGSVRLWDATTGQELHQMAGHRFNGAYSVAFGPQGQSLSGGGDGAMYLWNLATGQRVRTFTCHTKPGIEFAAVATVAYSENANLATTSGRNQPIRLWNLETGKEVRQVEKSDDAFVCFSPDGKRLAACYQGTLRIWEAKTGDELLRIDRRLSPDDGKYDTNSICVAFSPDGKRIVSGGHDDDKVVRVWDAKTGQELRKYEGHTSTVVGVTFFPDGRRITSASYDGTARIWVAPR